MVARTYQVASRQLLGQGREELAQGDTRQASEKGWGEAAQIVKAIGESRGWAHGGHGQLFTAVRNLREETGDEEISRLFHVANSLHNNFYENNQETGPCMRHWTMWIGLWIRSGRSSGKTDPLADITG